MQCGGINQYQIALIRALRQEHRSIFEHGLNLEPFFSSQCRVLQTKKVSVIVHMLGLLFIHWITPGIRSYPVFIYATVGLCWVLRQIAFSYLSFAPCVFGAPCWFPYLLVWQHLLAGLFCWHPFVTNTISTLNCNVSIAVRFFPFPVASHVLSLTSSIHSLFSSPSAMEPGLLCTLHFMNMFFFVFFACKCI